MLNSISASGSGDDCTGDGGENLEQRARVARQMVHELEEFLGEALSTPVTENGNSRWPLRYNSSTGIDSHMRTSKE